MMKRSRQGRILHSKRPVTTRRPMHLTKHTVPGVPSLRQPGAFALFRELLVQDAESGVVRREVFEAPHEQGAMPKSW